MLVMRLESIPPLQKVVNDLSLMVASITQSRIKSRVSSIHEASGKLSTVVAAPDQFTEEGEAPDVAVDEEGVVYALDFDRNMIRIFEPK